MESLDILILAVEASVAFAGFAGIIATFQFGEAKKVTRADAVGLTMILQFSLLAALIACIPLLLHTFGAKTTAVWATTSAFAAIIVSGAQYLQAGSLRKASLKNKSFLRLKIAVQCIGAGVILINALNFLDLFFHREPGPVIAAIIWALIITGFSFSRLLLLPIWRRVRIQEADTSADDRSGQLNAP